MGSELGPLEFAIIGNGLLLLLLFVLLLYMICRLTKWSKRDEEIDNIFATNAPHQPFSSLCGVPSTAQTYMDKTHWTSTLPKKSSMKGSSSGDENHHNHNVPMWITASSTPFHPHYMPQPQPLPLHLPLPMHYATLQMPVRKKKCGRVHSCRVIQTRPHLHTPHLINPSLNRKKLNVDFV